MNSRNFPAILDTLASSIFRRGVRLFLPITTSTFMSLLFEMFHFYPQEYWGKLPVHAPTIAAQINDWYMNLLITIDPFQTIDPGNPLAQANPYDIHLWTIPYEFRGSIVVFLVLLAFAKAKPMVRLILMGLSVIYVMHIGHWDIGLFLGGSFLSALQIFRRNIFPSQPSGMVESPNPPLRPRGFRVLTNFFLQHHTFFGHLLTIPLCFAGLWLVGLPTQDPGSSPGFIWIYSWTPSQYHTGIANWHIEKFWNTVGALMLLTAMSFSPPIGSSDNATPLLQILFNTRFSQYLGDISFSLYMIHGPIIYSVGYVIRKHADEVSPDLYWWGFVKFILIVGGLTLWIADLFTRFVDVPSVKVGKWLADKCFVREER